MQGRYLSNSKWAPCGPDEEALAEDDRRRQVNNVAGAAFRPTATEALHCILLYPV